jgi:hypothetical protein
MSASLRSPPAPSNSILALVHATEVGVILALESITIDNVILISWMNPIILYVKFERETTCYHYSKGTKSQLLFQLS